MCKNISQPEKYFQFDWFFFLSCLISDAVREIIAHVYIKYFLCAITQFTSRAQPHLYINAYEWCAHACIVFSACITKNNLPSKIQKSIFIELSTDNGCATQQLHRAAHRTYVGIFFLRYLPSSPYARAAHRVIFVYIGRSLSTLRARTACCLIKLNLVPILSSFQIDKEL